MPDLIDGGSAVNASILIVDDEPVNRKLLRTQLEQDNYNILEAGDGEDAWDKAQEHLPDIILLDIMMPGVNGIETCERLKNDSRTAHIPVILVTAQRERQDRLAGIAAGASDFLTKPVDTVDLRLRVKNWVNTKRLYDRVQAEYDRVAELEQLRDRLVHMVVHDMRTPLTCMRWELDMALSDGAENMGPAVKTAIDKCSEAAGVIQNLINSMLDVSRIESGEMSLKKTATDLEEIVSDALGSLGSQSDRITVQRLVPADSTAPSCDPEIVGRVIVNLLSNAIDYSPENEPVTVTIDCHNGSAVVAVSDNGPGIPDEFKDRIFDKFTQVAGRTKIRKASTGLGLAFCKLAVEAHDGTIGVDSEEGKGSTFWFKLPISD